MVVGGGGWVARVLWLPLGARLGRGCGLLGEALSQRDGAVDHQLAGP